MDAVSVCRLCLKLQDTESTFLILNENKPLVELIFYFFEIEVIPDSLEDYYLCIDCHNVLQDFNEFKTKCIKNDKEFRTRYQFKQEPIWEVKTGESVIQSEIQPCLQSLPHGSDIQLEPTVEHQLESQTNPNTKDAGVKKMQIKNKTPYARDRRKIPCHMCGKLVSNAAYTVHVSLHNVDRQRFPCQICNRSYRQKHNLTKHLNTHTKKVLFPCKVENCGKVFDVASTLRKHFKIMHTDVRDHVCKICGRGFAIASGLSGHMRTKHCPEKTHACLECGKLFKTPGEVRLHLKIHTRRDPYVCPECNEAFPKSSILKDHRAKVHNFPNIANLDAVTQ